MKRLVLFSSAFVSLIISGHSIVSRIDFLEKRDTYLVGEPPIVKCYLYNTGNDTGYVDRKDWARTIIINSKGDTLKQRRMIGGDVVATGAWKPFTVIPPKDTIYSMIYISNYGNLLATDIPHCCHRIFPAGEYTIKIWYYIPKRVEDVARRNKRGGFRITKKLTPENCYILESNTLKMKIQEPEGKEKEAWDILKDIYIHSRSSSKTVKEAKMILTKYADTRYAPAAFQYLIFSFDHFRELFGLRIYGKDTKEEAAKEFLKRYPNSAIGAYVIGIILDECYKYIMDGEYEKEIETFDMLFKNYRDKPANWGIMCSGRSLWRNIEREKILKLKRKKQ